MTSPAKIRQLKLVLLGSLAVGKSSLALRFVNGKFHDKHENTIGAAFLTQIVSINDTIFRFEIWDTAGQERYSTIIPMYYRGAQAAIVVYDIQNYDTFTRAKRYISELYEQDLTNIVIALAGNKSDLIHQNNNNRAVNIKEAEKFARENGLIFFETSAKTATNVNDIFMDVVKKLPKTKRTEKNDVTRYNVLGEQQDIPEPSKCCK